MMIMTLMSTTMNCGEVMSSPRDDKYQPNKRDRDFVAFFELTFVPWACYFLKEQHGLEDTSPSAKYERQPAFPIASLTDLEEPCATRLVTRSL
jgi:hypothetical protein